MNEKCCYARGGMNIFFMVLMLAGVIILPCVYVYDRDSSDAWMGLAATFCYFIVLVYEVLRWKNYRVYVKDNKVFYVNWRNKEFVYDMKTLKKFSIEGGKGLSLYFPHWKKVTIWSYYQNYVEVRNEIAEAFKNTRNNANVDDSEFI